LSRQDLNADPLVGGKVAATKKALQRLVKRGLIEVAEQAVKAGCPPIHLYRAVLSFTSSSCVRGETELVSSEGHIPSAGTDETGDSLCPVSEGVPGVELVELDRGHLLPEDTTCPQADPSVEAESAAKGHSGQYPHARAELDKLDDEATAFWKE
jgi:hypothetical protein